MYFRHRGEFFNLVNDSRMDWDNEEHRDLLRSMLMTASDVAAITKPWEIQKRVCSVLSNSQAVGDCQMQVLRDQKIFIGLDSFSNQCLKYLAQF